MATPAQVATDLALWAGRLRGTHSQGHTNDPLAASLVRGQKTILELLDRVDRIEATLREVEAAAEAEANRYERYVNGDDHHG